MISKIVYFITLLILVLNNLSCLAETPKNKVVILAPLSGPLSEYGVATVNGINLAKQLDSDLLNKIDLIIEDNQYNPTATVSLYRKYRADPEVKLIYNWGANPSGAIAPIADRECFPLFMVDLSISSYQSSKQNNKNCIFNFVNSELDVTKPLANYLIKNDYKKIGIVKTENAYINGMIRGLSYNSKEKLNIEIVVAIDYSQTDFRSIILKMKKNKFDAIGAFLFPGQIREFYQQMSELNYKLPTFGTDVFESKEEIVLAESSMQGAVYSHLNVSDKFRDLYFNKFKNDSQISSAGAAYDFVKLVATILSKKSDYTNEELIAVLKGLPEQRGVLGNYYFEENQVEGARFKFPVFLKMVKGDSFSIVE